LSGRNIDEEVFEKHLSDSAFNDASC
jgi:hypothetical protein